MKKRVQQIIVGLLAGGIILNGMVQYDFVQAEDGHRGDACTENITVGKITDMTEESHTMDMFYHKKSLSNDVCYTVKNMGEVLSMQMDEYLAGNSGIEAEDAVFELGQGLELKSSITFWVADYHIPYNDDYFYDCFLKMTSEYPNLSAFYRVAVKTQRDTVNGMKIIKSISLYSPFTKEEIKPKTMEYCKKLEELVSIPEKSDMSDMEKLLYLHDELIIRTIYDDDVSNINCYLPIGLLLEGKAVCDAYAKTFNQAALRLGLKSLYLISTYNVEMGIPRHAWNAVELNGKWYYIDATFDDCGPNLDVVSHDYFLFTLEDLPATNIVHKLSEGFMQETYGYVTDNMGDAYKNLFLKKVNGQMNYLNGIWYYSDNSEIIYCWDGKNTEETVLFSPQELGIQKCAVYNGKLYIGGEEGLYSYEDGKWTLLLDTVIENMIIVDGVIHYKTEGEWETEIPDNLKPVETVSPFLDQNLTPDRVTILSIKNNKKKSIDFKIKEVQGAAGYQYCYSENNKFKNCRTKITRQLTVTINNCKKNRTYYIKTRAYSMTEGKKNYGKWSVVKKIRIKK